MIELRPLTLPDMQTVRLWRHEARETLRTPYMLTAEMQEQYYRDVICNRESRTRYWGLHLMIPVGIMHGDGRTAFDSKLIGYGGLENISWENGNAEISLLIGSDCRRRGYGREAVTLFLEEAFDRMRLHTVYGECYECGVPQFWESLQPSYLTTLPFRKFWHGRYWNAMYFSFQREDYENLVRDTGEGAEYPDSGEEHEAVPGDTGDRVFLGSRSNGRLPADSGIE